MQYIAAGRCRLIELGDVREAAHAVRSYIRRTPVIRLPALDTRVGTEVYLKLECQQHCGVFKVRGAHNAIGALPSNKRARGVVAVSSGNHAQAVGLAAANFGVSALVLMPEDAPVVKRRAAISYGAEVETFDRYSTDREALLRSTAEATGRTVIHPFDDPRVMAGQGTAALEFVEEVGDLSDLVVPVGGGGLIAGCSTVMSALLPSARTWGVEPEAGNDAQLSLREGRRLEIEVPRTIADGLQLVSPGARPFEVMRRRVHDVVTVSDSDIIAAMRFLLESASLVVEPSGAAALAAVMTGRISPAGSRLGVMVSGANIDRDRFGSLLGL
jgi:threonine dehydratase